MTTFLFALIGKSGSGKSTLFKGITAKHPEYNKILTSTTRERRDGEVDGEEYNFTKSIPNLDTIAEIRKYDTATGRVWYFTDAMQLKKDAVNIQICTLESYRAMVPYCVANNIRIVPVLVSCSLDERIKRCVARNNGTIDPEIMRRLTQDELDFNHDAMCKFVIDSIEMNGSAMSGWIQINTDQKTDVDELEQYINNIIETTPDDQEVQENVEQ